MSDLRIRNVSPVAIAALDEQAKAKGMSRSAYLRIVLERAASLPAIEQTEERYAALIKTVCEFMGGVTERLDALELAINMKEENKK